MVQPVHSEKEKAHNFHVIFVIKPDMFNILHLIISFCGRPFTSSNDIFQDSAQGQGSKIIYIFNICIIPVASSDL